MENALIPLGAERRYNPLAGIARAIGAWLAAVMAAAFSLTLAVAIFALVEEGRAAIDGISGALAIIPMALFVAVFVAAMTALPWPVLVLLAKFLRLHRGFADLVLGAIMGGMLIEMMSNPTASQAWGVTLVFALAGAVGGLTYWLVAGRPQ